jgi:hypothetical protein
MRRRIRRPASASTPSPRPPADGAPGLQLGAAFAETPNMALASALADACKMRLDEEWRKAKLAASD